MFAGVDLGGTKCLGVVLRGADIAAERRIATPSGANALVDAIAGMVEALAGDVGGPVDGMGLGAPGLVDRDGVLRLAPNLPGVRDVPLRDALRTRLGMPVYVDNDATCAAWGEHTAGAARGLSDFVLVTLGTGIGGGLVREGTIDRGNNGFAGEIGHMVVDPNGPECPCGQRGCWERFASGSGLGRLARDLAMAGRSRRVVDLAGGDPEAVRGEHVAQAAREGDDAALVLIARFARWVALGLVNLANILDPAAFVIGGGLVSMADLLLDPTRAAFAELDYASSRRRVDIVRAELGERAGAIGAAALAESTPA